MTWFIKEGGYELFFNRDERLTRHQAEPPTRQQGKGIGYLSPTDTDAGGTWIASNEYGVTVCLLNHYQFEQIETYKRWVSRGEIVREYALTVDILGVEREFKAKDLSDYRAFRMFIIDQQGNNRLCIWDGHSAKVDINVAAPKSSSSVDARYVKQTRKVLFDKLQLNGSNHSQDYIDFHSSHLPSRSKESVCMHRDDAKTVSLSHVDVNHDRVSFSYADGSPCESELGKPLSLDILSATEPCLNPKAAIAG